MGEKQTIPNIRHGETLGLRTLGINQGESEAGGVINLNTAGRQETNGTKRAQEQELTKDGLRRKGISRCHSQVWHNKMLIRQHDYCTGVP